jgi:hypothetical protein
VRSSCDGANTVTGFLLASAIPARPGRWWVAERALLEVDEGVCHREGGEVFLGRAVGGLELVAGPDLGRRPDHRRRNPAQMVEELLGREVLGLVLGPEGGRRRGEEHPVELAHVDAPCLAARSRRLRP